MPDTAGLGELWVLASRLRECCTIEVDVTAHPPGWKVTVHSLKIPGLEAEGVADHLLAALAIAVNRADVAGMVPAKV